MDEDEAGGGGCQELSLGDWVKGRVSIECQLGDGRKGSDCLVKGLRGTRGREGIQEEEFGWLGAQTTRKKEE